jgi:uncharacterized membrane protein YagU involved in acid resistance
MNGMLVGAAAGAAATVPMTIVMETLHRQLPGEPPRPLPPREVVDGVAVKAGVHRELNERDMQQLTLAAHFGYGAVCGALFGLVAPRNVPAAMTAGVMFGVGVWAGSYLGWLPALGVRQPATQDPRARSGLMIAAHIVWGAAAGAIVASAHGSERRTTRSDVRGLEL